MTAVGLLADRQRGTTMPLLVTRNDWRELLPKAPPGVIDAFDANAAVLGTAGITDTKTRFAFALANVDHECDGFQIRNLIENINYSAERLAEVFPSRYASADEVRARHGTAPGWQKLAFDEIYGNRMGNRPGTTDGSTYIGRGGPQITGRDGYDQVGQRCQLNLVANPDLASLPQNQPAILAAFWTWKKLNTFADNGDFVGCVRAWNCLLYTSDAADE